MGTCTAGHLCDGNDRNWKLNHLGVLAGGANEMDRCRRLDAIAAFRGVERRTRRDKGAVPHHPNGPSPRIQTQFQLSTIQTEPRARAHRLMPRART